MLEPEDYTAKIYSSTARYQQAYSLWMVWQRDLLTALEREGSTKNQKYLIAEAIERLEEMTALLVPEKREGLEGIIASYLDIQKDYEEPDAFRSKGVMIRKLNSNGKKVRLQYSPRVLEEGSYLGEQTGSEQ